MQSGTVVDYQPKNISSAIQSPAMSDSGTASETPVMSSSPWGKVAAPITCSLEEVMSEELADQLQKQEYKEHMEEQDAPPTEELVDIDALMATEMSDDTKDDFLLAQMLQHEFDREHDAILTKEEDKWNGSSKVKISFQNYRSLHPRTHKEEEEADEEEVWENEDKDDPIPKFNKAGISGKGKNIVTKHDANITGQRNAMKVMDQFPPDFETGDGRKIKMRLPNTVYNKLKRHSQQEDKRSHKVHEKKEHSTTELAVDARTRLILYKLVNNGVLDSMDGVISSGKEAVVFHGSGGTMNNALVPEECAIKVFKTTLSEFKNRFQYVRGDVRFMKDDYKKYNPRKIIKVWAEKELANLKKMESCGIPCPRAVILKKHILVMQFIGKDQVPAPKLQDARLSPENLELAYEQCVQNMKTMYQKASLVHADLSAYNMLWYDDTLYFIDVAQGVDIMHPQAMEFLLRDCGNVSQYFADAGVHRVLNKYDLFNEITGLELMDRGKEFLAQIGTYEKDEEKLRMGEGKDYAFDYFFDKAQKERDDKRKKVEELFEDSEESEEESIEEDILAEKSKLDPEVDEKLHQILRLENVVEVDELQENEVENQPGRSNFVAGVSSGEAETEKITGDDRQGCSVGTSDMAPAEAKLG